MTHPKQKFQVIGTDPTKVMYPAYYQPKHDGMRAYYIKSKDKGHFYTRGDQILTIDLDIKPGIYDGELLVEGKTRSEANGLYNHAFKISGVLPKGFKFIIFDQPHPNSWYCERLKILEALSLPEGFEIIKTEDIHSYKDISNLMARASRLGLEGYVIKDKHLIWSPKKTNLAFKLKVSHRMKMVITSLTPGKRKHTGSLGSFLCRSLDGIYEVKVGTGFSDLQRTELNNLNMIGKEIVVEYQEKTSNSLISTRFISLTETKS